MPISDSPKLMWQMSETPNFIGLTLSEAGVIILEYSFVLGTVIYYYHPSIEDGKIMSHDPIYSTSGSIINLVVSKGVDPDRTDNYVSKDNTIVVYIKGNLDSEEFAEYYADIHNMNTSTDGPIINGYERWEIKGQTVGVDCVDTEILDDESVFNDELLIPLQEALETSFLGSQNIVNIVLGYNIPGGFYSDISSPFIIASSSRISRGCSKKDGIFNVFSSKIKNKFYKRQVFSRLSSEDVTFGIICSRIDAPTLDLAKEFVDNAEIVSRQSIINGKIYVDPYFNIVSDEAETYKESILSFYNNFLSTLSNETSITNYIDSNYDSIIPYIENDSFVWSWSKSTSYSDFFQTSVYPRVFFYNADVSGAESFRDIDLKKWGIQSMKAKYSCYAGAMSDPTIEGYLDPASFYKSLKNGATIGEAFLFSSPFLDWTIGLFGDPLVKVTFPLTIAESENIDPDQGWYLLSKQLGKVAAHLLKKQNESNEIQQGIVNSGIFDFEIDTLLSANNLYIQNNNISISSMLIKPVRDLFEFPVKKNKFYGLTSQFPNINTYLTQKEFKISTLLNNALDSSPIVSANILDEGWWEIEVYITDEYFGYENYYFELEIYENESCTIKATNPLGEEINILNSYETILGWTYEKEEYVFEDVPFSGVPSSYVDRRIRYTSRKDTSIGLNEYLTRGQVYYFKIRQFVITEEGTQYFNWVIYEDIIFS
jgi:hypothetical protein